jgi:hypothetical protein
MNIFTRHPLLLLSGLLLLIGGGVIYAATVRGRTGKDVRINSRSTSSSSLASSGVPSAGERSSPIQPDAQVPLKSSGVESQSFEPPKQGNYFYDVSGSGSFAGNQAPAAKTIKLTVFKPEGFKQSSIREFKDENNNGSLQQDEQRYRIDGIYLLSRKVLATSHNGYSRTQEYEVSPSALVVPFPQVINQPWTQEFGSKDGCFTQNVEFRVMETDALAIIAEEPIKVVRIVSVTRAKMTGRVGCTPLESTTTSTLWFSPAYRLFAKEETKAEGTVRGIAFTTEYTAVLHSTKPS